MIFFTSIEKFLKTRLQNKHILLFLIQKSVVRFLKIAPARMKYYINIVIEK